MKTNELLTKENMKLLSEKENMESRIKELERLNNRYSKAVSNSELEMERFKELATQAEMKAAEYGVKVDCLRSFLYRASQMNRNIEVRGVTYGKVRITTCPKIDIHSSYGDGFLKTETVEMIEF